MMLPVYFPVMIAAAPEDQIGPQGLDWVLDNIDSYDVGIYDECIITPFLEDNRMYRSLDFANEMIQAECLNCDELPF